MNNTPYKQNQRPVIYIVDASIDITGAFICVCNEAKLLKNEVDFVIVLPTGTQIEKDNLVNFTKVIYLPIVNIRKSLKRIIAYIPLLIYSSWKLKKFMKQDKCENLQLNDFYLMHGVFNRLFGFKGNIVTWVRINPLKYGSFFSKIWLKLDYRFSNKIVAVSQFILNILPSSNKNILTYDPVFRRENIHKKYINKSTNITRKLVYIGNYIEGKGQQYAIEVFNDIASNYPDVQLHFYGGDMGLEKNRRFLQSLKDKATNSDYVNQIYFHGFVDDIRSVFEDAYAALNFSDSESYSLSCLEASYHGIPLVATKSGGPQEIIQPGKTGFLVDIRDIKMMTSAINKLLEDNNLAKKMGKEAAVFVKDKFSEAQFKNEIIGIFNLLNNKQNY